MSDRGRFSFVSAFTFRENGRLNHISKKQRTSKERKNEERIRKWQRKNKERAIGLPYRFVV